MKEIYLAGGCFWGVEEYFSRIPGIDSTIVGYANSDMADPTYQQVCSGVTNAAEAIYLTYDEKEITLDRILDYYFRIIDPVSVNKQGGDIGTQYRTGIYYVESKDFETIKKHMDKVQKEYSETIVVEVMS